MSDYTPTTEWVVSGWMKARAADGIPADVALEEINRWLTEHDRQVKAEAWDECLESLRPELEHELLYVKTVNPYREEVNDAKPRAMQ